MAFGALDAMFEKNLPGSKKHRESASSRRESKSNWRKHYVAPRSMTEEEKAYYGVHKSLHGFKSLTDG